MDIANAITSSKIIAVVRLDEYTFAVDVARALVAGGITTLEFTLTGRGAIDAVSRTRAALGDVAAIGIGTALTAQDTSAAIDAGAQFVVTPAVRREVIATCVERNVPVACGALTPTELLNAHEAGATFVKLFPASAFGPRYIKDVLAPLPFLKIIPTGGVSAENARDFISAGAVAVGVGGNLIPAHSVASGNFDLITAKAQEYVRALR